MRPVARLLLAAAVVALPVGLAAVNCGTDAQNIQACREIESARCDLAPACSPGFDVDGCKTYYRDACLVGTSQPDAGDISLANPCIAALQACGTASPLNSGEGCPGQMLVPGASCQVLNPVDGGTPTVAVPATPCNIIMHCPEVLQACAWVASGDAGTDASDGSDGSDDGGDTDGGDTGDGGDGG